MVNTFIYYLLLLFFLAPSFFKPGQCYHFLMVMHEIDCGSMTRLSRKRVENELKMPREGRICNTEAISNLHIYLFTNFSEKCKFL